MAQKQNKRTSKAYVFTVYKDSPEVLEQLKRLQDLRASVSLINKHSNYKHYVKLQGRWGRKNPRYVRRSFPFATLEEASRWDVYVYHSHTIRPEDAVATVKNPNGGFKYVI